MGLASGSTFGPDTHLISESKASWNLELADWLDCLTNAPGSRHIPAALLNFGF